MKTPQNEKKKTTTKKETVKKGYDSLVYSHMHWQFKVNHIVKTLYNNILE